MAQEFEIGNCPNRFRIEEISSFHLKTKQYRRETSDDEKHKLFLFLSVPDVGLGPGGMAVNGRQHSPSSHGALVQWVRQLGSHMLKCILAHYDKCHQERLWSVGYETRA